MTIGIALDTSGLAYISLGNYDEAANSSTSSAAARPSGPLVSPVPGAVVTAPPRLAWKPVKGATYYHVQLWRHGRILSAWPSGTRFQLRRSWVYNGRRHRLRPGLYRWYVWPGHGRPVQKKFGRLIGSSSFRVRLARSQDPGRQRQKDHVSEDEEEQRESSDHEQRVR